METKIHSFRKTDHFLYRQWDRNVSDELLKTVLKKVNSNTNNHLIVISRNYLKRNGLKIKCELFIKIKGNILITCFYSDFNCYFNRKIDQNYLLIQ